MSAFGFLVMLPFLVEAALYAVDEFYFHWRRRLRRFEVIFHPIAVLINAICFTYLLLIPPSAEALFGYAILSFFASLEVAIDEWVHVLDCDMGEHVVHALQYLTKPFVQVSAGFIWWFGSTPDSPLSSVHILLNLSLTGSLLLFLYQIIYWNGPWQKKKPYISLGTARKKTSSKTRK